jgi:hypothetical protein
VGQDRCGELCVAVVFCFEQFAAVDLAVCELDGDDVALRLVEQFDRDANGCHCLVR